MKYEITQLQINTAIGIINLIKVISGPNNEAVVKISIVIIQE